MTEKSTDTPGSDPAAGDQVPYTFGYGHGRMPAFLKLAWVTVLAFMTWYVVKFLITSVGTELSGR